MAIFQGAMSSQLQIMYGSYLMRKQETPLGLNLPPILAVMPGYTDQIRVQ
jgi:hypothetical protein